MEKAVIIRHPLQWTAVRLEALTRAQAVPRSPCAAVPVPNRITNADLRASLNEGLADFLSFRSDVIILCVMYPLVGLLLWRLASGYNLVQLAFPLAAGFALVGPLFATGLYEMSRQNERGVNVTWSTAFDAFRSPGIGGIVALGVVLMMILGAWLLVAQAIYAVTIGPLHPATLGQFADDVMGTRRGEVLVVLGVGIGFLFAALSLCISVISFPMLLDREVGVVDAVRASIAVARKNPNELANWGLLVAGLLVLGSLPVLVGLIVVLPVLGHATWHLYRKLMPPA